MKILFVTINDPFGVGGGDFATHAYLKAFSHLCNGDIDVFVREGVKPDGSIDAHFFYIPERNWMARMRSLLNGVLHRNVKAVKSRLAEGVKYDYCVFNNSRVAVGLIEQVKALGIKTITIHHNVEKEIVLGNTPNPLRRMIFSRLVVKGERRAYLLSDYNLFLTRQDKQTFHRIYGESQSVEGIIGTFDFKALPALTLKETDKRHLIFAITGSLNLHQGIDGIRYFFEELYHILPEGSKLIISGRNPTQEIRALCNRHDNVQLIPNPEDMSEVINKADIYICPTRLGGGLKLRVMDGLRLGIPVITHTCSARGYDDLVDAGCVSTFNNKEEFSTGLGKMMRAIQAGAFNRLAIRQEYEKVFSFEAGLERLKAIILVNNNSHG